MRTAYTPTANLATQFSFFLSFFPVCVGASTVSIDVSWHGILLEGENLSLSFLFDFFFFFFFSDSVSSGTRGVREWG